MGEIVPWGHWMAVDQGILYSPASDRMMIVDARDPDRPSRLAEYRPDWSRCAALPSPQPSISLVAVEKGLVFFTSVCSFLGEFRQFEVVEASDPADPLLADFTPIDASAMDLQTRLPFVYMADGEDLWVMDLSGPSIKGSACLRQGGR